MINIETDKEIKTNSDDLNLLSKKYFTQYANEDIDYLSPNEFYSFLENFLQEYNKKELFDSLKEENLFLTYLNDHKSNRMNLDEFSSAFNDIYALVKQTEDSNIDVDFKFEDADINTI
jgi:hypothetical protein